jgi:pSer/pThr/pTyr-binding forkhead associated (FHA) protein
MRRKFTLGRGRTCDVVLADASVSRHHAELERLDDGQWLLIDCHSSRGTAICTAGKTFLPVHQALVSPTDTVRFGELEVPVKALLEAVQRRFPTRAHPRGEALPPARPWVQGRRLVRCACGHPKPADGPCPECGR